MTKRVKTDGDYVFDPTFFDPTRSTPLKNEGSEKRMQGQPSVGSHEWTSPTYSSFDAMTFGKKTCFQEFQELELLSKVEVRTNGLRSKIGCQSQSLESRHLWHNQQGRGTALIGHRRIVCWFYCNPYLPLIERIADLASLIIFLALSRMNRTIHSRDTAPKA